MKKLILLLFGLLLSHFVFAQAPAGYYNYDMVLTTRDPGHKIGCENHIQLFLQFNNNTKQIGFGEQNLGGAPNPYDLGFNLRQIATDKLSGAYTISSRNKDGGCGCGACGATSINNERINVTMGYATFLCTGSAKSSDAWDTSLAIKRTPELKIVDNSNGVTRFNYFEVDDPNGIVINSYSGFDASDYNWEYVDPFDSSIPKKWLPLLNFNGQSSINLTIADINTNGKNPKQFYNTLLSVRQVGCNNSASVPIVYSLVKTPPLLVSATPPAMTKCAYSTDGKIQFTFNRPLETDETFAFNLKRYNPITGLYDKSDVVSYDVVNTATNSQCTLKNLPPGKYQATYQTKFPNDVVTNPPTTLNSKDKPINDFEIVAPTPLKYTARMAQPKCATDGAEIVVNATGGTPPYSYSINGAPAVKYIDTDEKGLPKGDYIIPLNNNIPNKTKITIKVTDKQGCVDGDTQAPQ
jgi:SprB repeat